MKLGIKFCGGCNPHIDRTLLTRRIREKLDLNVCDFEYFDFRDCEAVLVVNGCNVACAEIQNDTKTIVVSGLDIDGSQYPEEILPTEVIRRLPLKAAV